MNAPYQKLAWLVSSLLILTACNTTPTKPSSLTETRTHFEIGSQAFEQYRSSGATSELNTALIHLDQAREQTPDNIYYQKMYYLALYISTGMQQNLSEFDTLKSLYNTLHPIVQADTPPPSRLRWLAAQDTEDDLTALTPVLQDMIREQPRNAQSWHTLSEHYEQRKLYWLAIYASQQANQLLPNNPDIMYQLGDSLNDIIQQSDCRYEQREYAKLAVGYIAKAAAKKPSQLYYDNASLQYLRLGLFPLAYLQAKKAWELEQNHWTAWHFGTAAIFNKRYEEALQAADHLINSEKENSAYSLKAQAHIGLGQTEQANKALTTLVESAANTEGKKPSATPKEDPLLVIQASWIGALINRQNPSINTIGLGETSWQETIVAQVKAKQVEPSLSSYAANECQLTEAYFYQAYIHWLNNKPEKSRALLQKARDSSATLYDEFIWATIILDSKLL